MGGFLRWLAALAASVALIAVFSAAPASATLHGCSVPHVPNWTFTELSEKGMGCEHAQDRALYVKNNGRAPTYRWDGFTCHAKIIHRGTRWECTNSDGVRAFTTS